MSSDDSAFAKQPDHVVARVLAALDIKSRLRMAFASTRFWRVCFESHRPAVWRCVEVAEAECRDLAKYEQVVQEVSDMVKSLVIEEFSEELLDRLPAMNSLMYLKLGGCFRVNDDMVGSLASRFPEAVSICAQEAQWNLSALESTSVAFPNLNELNVFYIIDMLGQTELNELINALDGIQTVHVNRLRVRAADGPGIGGNPVDRLAGTRWGKGVRDLAIYFQSSEPLISPPQTPIADFERLENLTVYDAEEQMVDWLKTMCTAPKLRRLYLYDCIGLDRLWGSESCFPVGVSEIGLNGCCDMDDRFISQITRHLTSLNYLTVFSTTGGRDIKFNVSAALQVLLHADSSLEVVRFGGYISPEHNSVNELRHVYNHFMENTGALAKLKKLHLNLLILTASYGELVNLKLDGDCDWEELARRLPNPETKIYFSEGRQIPASAD